MDRILIKQNAQKMIKGNLWYILKPLVYFCLVVLGASIIAAILDNATDAQVFGAIINMVTSFASCIFAVGYGYYCLQFVRGNRMEVKDVCKFCLEHWLISFLVSLLVGLNTIIGFILLIIPGYMAAIGLTFYCYVIADNPELSTREILVKAWEITNGYKWDLFVFYLSFLGWIIVAALTLGILYIWLIPYMTIAEVLAYETLKK